MNWFKTKEKTKALTIFNAETEEPKQVVMAGELYFTIIKNGNGQFAAQYKNKDRWLYVGDESFHLHHYENATFFSTYERCERRCMDYIRFHEKKVVGLIQVVK